MCIESVIKSSFADPNMAENLLGEGRVSVDGTKGFHGRYFDRYHFDRYLIHAEDSDD